MQSLINLGVIWLFRYVGKTRVMSALCNISFSIIPENIWYFSEWTTSNTAYNNRVYQN